MEGNASSVEQTEVEGQLSANCVRVPLPRSLADIPSLCRIMEETFGYEEETENQLDSGSQPSPPRTRKLKLLADPYDRLAGAVVGVSEDEYIGRETFIGVFMKNMRRMMQRFVKRRHYGDWDAHVMMAYEEGVEDPDTLEMEANNMDSILRGIDNEMCVFAMGKIKDRSLRSQPDEVRFWRRMFAVLKLIKVGILALRCRPMEDVIKECDIGYLYGEVICDDIIAQVANELDVIIMTEKERPREQSELLDVIKLEIEDDDQEENEEQEFSPAPLQNVTGNCRQLVVIHRPFWPELVSYMGGSTPCIIHDIVEHWNAVKVWSVEHLEKVVGHRVVPVMTADQRSLEGWKEEVMTVSEFIKKYIKRKGTASGEIGYVTEYDIFTHLRRLSQDVEMLQYLEDKEEDGRRYVVNREVKGWFCPTDTLTPLHYSDKHRILVQIFGSRLVRLFPPSESKILRSYPGASQDPACTHIEMPVEAEDLFEKAPGMRDVMHYDLQLDRGQSLYIPRNWWCYARTTAPSFSASFLYNYSRFGY